MRALVFDCDGVLAETERDGHRVAFNRTFEQFGLAVQWSESDYATMLAVAGGKERLRHLCTPEFIQRHDLPTEPTELEAVIARWHRRKTENFLAMVADSRMEPRAGVGRLAEQALENGWRVGIASTSALESVEAIARRALGERILEEAVVVAGDMVRNKKPAPDVYIQALQALGVSPPSAVAVEDSRIGVKAARAAGVGVIATMSYYTRDEDLTDAQIVVDSLGEPGGAPLEVASNRTSVPVADHVGWQHVTACAHLNASSFIGPSHL